MLQQLDLMPLSQYHTYINTPLVFPIFPASYFVFSLYMANTIDREITSNALQ